MSDGEAAIEAAALRLLARREYARAELRSRLLRQSGFAAEAVIPDKSASSAETMRFAVNPPCAET